MNSRRRGLALLLVALLLPACGGNGAAPSAGTIYAPGTGEGSIGPGFGGPLQPEVLFTVTKSPARELFAADLGGATIVNLSGPLVAGGNVEDFKWSPDRSLVAFTAGKDSQVPHLYVVPATGGPAIQVSPSSDYTILDFAWSADSAVVGFIVRPDVFAPFTVLYAANADGSGGPVPVYPGGADPPTVISRFKFSPDPASHSILHATTPGDLRRDSDPAVLGTNVGDFDWAPHGPGFAFTDSATGALKVNTPSPGPLTLAPSATRAFAWSPDSLTIAYTSELTMAGRVDLRIDAANGTMAGTLGSMTP